MHSLCPTDRANKQLIVECLSLLRFDRPQFPTHCEKGRIVGEATHVRKLWVSLGIPLTRGRVFEVGPRGVATLCPGHCSTFVINGLRSEAPSQCRFS